MKKKKNIFKTLFTLPVTIYAFVLILLPLVYIFFLSFCKSDSYGGILYQFNLNNYINIFDMTYMKILLKSSLIALITTIIFHGCSSSIWR